ncbi:MAG TPA: ribosomal protein S18-alanine N-acetyltransferase [Terriglobales bacterium]|nr:ribosomal protein S18-alanine N-acetyltransferase [Terriglobales bacterium]
MLIRPATPADIPAIMSLIAEAPTAAQWPQEHYEQAIQNSYPRRVILVLVDKTILAFLVSRTVAEEWELENIAVASNARRKGLGSALLKEFLKLAQNEKARAVFLEVRESNNGARNFYEKFGFEKAGRRPDYYANPREDAIVYRCVFF